MKQYVLSRSEMYEADKRCIQDFGIPSQVLMENAGRLSADLIIKEINNESFKVKSILLICGDGNNGGDGFVIARYLSQSYNNIVIFFTGETEKMSPETYLNYKLCQKLEIEIVCLNSFSSDIKHFDVIIDSVYGIGFRGDLPKDISSIFHNINNHKGLKIAIDIPSGLNADTGEADKDTFKADITITMAQTKIGHYLYRGSVFAGKIFTVDIGIPHFIYDKIKPKMILFQRDDLLIPKRFKNSHKGMYGRLGIIAGSPSMTGAAILSAKASLNCGTGLINLYHHKGLETIFETSLIEVMTKYFDTDSADLVDEVLTKDVLLIGPGLGLSEWSKNCLSLVLQKYDKPLIIDADAINLISYNDDLAELFLKKAESSKSPIIISPHIAEFSRLATKLLNEDYTIDKIEKAPIDILNKFLKKYNIYILLKNHYCICANRDNYHLISGGNDGLSTGGSGDVLSGMIASFLVQNIQHFYMTNNTINKLNSLNDIVQHSVSSAVFYLYETVEKINKNILTPAINPCIVVESLFKK